MRELYNMNISNATLFPGLDGLARSLAYELEFHWAFDPITMDVFTNFSIGLMTPNQGGAANARLRSPPVQRLTRL